MQFPENLGSQSELPRLDPQPEQITGTPLPLTEPTTH